MHVDRVPRVATIGDEAEDGPAGLGGFEETVSETRETAPVNKLGKQKRHGRKPSEYLSSFNIMYCSTSVHR